MEIEETDSKALEVLTPEREHWRDLQPYPTDRLLIRRSLVRAQVEEPVSGKAIGDPRTRCRPFSDIRCPDRVRHQAAARPRARPPEDTINVLVTERIQHIVRLVGINAPERKQPFSEVAHQHLAALVLLRDVVVN
jgi:endonuclease YncB( thermonuclease family)